MGVFRSDVPVRDMHRSLGDAIHVGEYYGRSETLEVRTKDVRIQRLATENNPPQG